MVNLFPLVLGWLAICLLPSCRGTCLQALSYGHLRRFCKMWSPDTLTQPDGVVRKNMRGDVDARLCGSPSRNIPGRWHPPPSLHLMWVLKNPSPQGGRCPGSLLPRPGLEDRRLRVGAGNQDTPKAAPKQAQDSMSCEQRESSDRAATPSQGPSWGRQWRWTVPCTRPDCSTPV